MFIENFQRVEKKYMLTKSEYETLLKEFNDFIEKDVYYESKICNIYYDTDNNDIIISSLEYPEYKEKVRLRSYFVPNEDSIVFLEIKKKYKGLVSKRRISLTLKDYYDYLDGKRPEKVNEQILNELDYTIKNSHVKPKIFLAYDRFSYLAKDNPSLRITFDKNIRSRRNDLKLEMGDAGKLYFKDDIYIMEIKTLDCYPLWLTHILSKYKIYPTSFSKYGSVYTNELKEERLYV